MIISENENKILLKYNIDYTKYTNLNDLLMEIDDEMTSYVDEYDEPLEEFLELERVYDEIYYKNTRN